MTPYPPFKTTTLSVYDITCPLLMTSHALYMTCHLLCMISHSLYVLHHTMPVSLTRHTLCLWHILFYGVTHHVMATQPLCNFTATMSDITPTVSVSSHPLDQFYQTQCMYDITANMCMTSYALHVTSHPQFTTSYVLYVWHQVHSIWHHIHCISVINPTLSMIPQPLYVWAHIQYICDITSTIFMT